MPSGCWSMINNLLDLARLEQGPHATPPAARSGRPSLLQAAAEAFRPRAEDRGVELVLEDGSAAGRGGRR